MEKGAQDVILRLALYQTGEEGRGWMVFGWWEEESRRTARVHSRQER